MLFIFPLPFLNIIELILFFLNSGELTKALVAETSGKEEEQQWDALSILGIYLTKYLH